MPRDTQDRLLWSGVVATLLFLAVLLAGHAWRRETVPGATDKGIERQLAYEARVHHLQSIYAPVTALRGAGQNQAALLKLDELSRQYPGEAHAFILKGEILREMGVLEEAVASYVAGVRGNGDYIDAANPLSRREEIDRLVNEGMRTISARARAHPENVSLATALKDLFYLQSRLAGGCE